MEEHNPFKHYTPEGLKRAKELVEEALADTGVDDQKIISKPVAMSKVVRDQLLEKRIEELEK